MSDEDADLRKREERDGTSHWEEDAFEDVESGDSAKSSWRRQWLFLEEKKMLLDAIEMGLRCSSRRMGLTWLEEVVVLVLSWPSLLRQQSLQARPIQRLLGADPFAEASIHGLF